ncbi:MAG: hypothetical protein UU10_C0022G0002 [Parcubacteria group bacterium GW2011_GWF1_40_6]|nr:MAG: hypothetical protein UU10_C0022G0002 [Parcubacteria group bacterium GW2011_GWF1_40_6]
MSNLTEKQSLCLSCQYCCKTIAFPFAADPVSLEFYKARGLKVIHSTETEESWVTFPHVCPHITKEGCNIYVKRPYACMVFDGSKHPVSSNQCLWPRKD